VIWTKLPSNQERLVEARRTKTRGLEERSLELIKSPRRSESTKGFAKKKRKREDRKDGDKQKFVGETRIREVRAEKGSL